MPEHKGHFVPFVLETHGGMGEMAAEFQQTLIKSAISQEVRTWWAPKEIWDGVHHSVAIALQRGNALVMATALHRYRRMVR